MENDKNAPGLLGGCACLMGELMESRLMAKSRVITLSNVFIITAAFSIKV